MTLDNIVKDKIFVRKDSAEDFRKIAEKIDQGYVVYYIDKSSACNPNDVYTAYFKKKEKKDGII